MKAKGDPASAGEPLVCVVLRNPSWRDGRRVDCLVLARPSLWPLQGRGVWMRFQRFSRLGGRTPGWDLSSLSDFWDSFL